MKVKEGDVLVCQCEDCNLELTVEKACTEEACGCDGCEVQVSCCDLPMVVKAKGGCCCGD